MVLSLPKRCVLIYQDNSKRVLNREKTTCYFLLHIFHSGWNHDHDCLFIGYQNLFHFESLDFLWSWIGNFRYNTVLDCESWRGPVQVGEYTIFFIVIKCELEPRRWDNIRMFWQPYNCSMIVRNHLHFPMWSA